MRDSFLQQLTAPATTTGMLRILVKTILLHLSILFVRPNEPSPYSIQYGSVIISQTEERSVNVKEIICGPFSMERLDNDVAVLKVSLSDLV